MKRLIEISRCDQCIFHRESGGLSGEARWCYHPKMAKDDKVCRQIYGEDAHAAFPSWCPLPIARDSEEVPR